MSFYMPWIDDYDDFSEKHSTQNTERAIKDLAYIWINFNDYEKQAFKNLIKKEGKKLEIKDKKSKIKELQVQIEKLGE